MKITSNTETRTYQRTGLRCQKCNTPFSVQMEVNVPVDQYVRQMNKIKCPKCGSNKLYFGLGLSLSEDRAMRKDGGTITERFEDWLENGETGLSSLYLGWCMHPVGKEASPAYPHDYDDLRRCILLLDRIPEWAPKMELMKKEKGWEKIATDWENIVVSVLQADPEALKPIAAKPILESIYYRGA